MELWKTRTFIAGAQRASACLCWKPAADRHCALLTKVGIFMSPTVRKRRERPARQATLGSGSLTCMLSFACLFLQLQTL